MTPKGPFDPFSNDGAGNGGRWDEIFVKSRVGGAVRKRPAQSSLESPEAEPLELEAEPTSIEGPPITRPQAKLANARWMNKAGYFNETAIATVDGEIPPESNHITRVVFTLCAKLPDGTNDKIESKEAHLKEGSASVEFTLWIPGFQDGSGQPPRKCEYFFLAKHRDSDKVRSTVLSVTPRKTSRNYPARDLRRGVRGEDVLGWQKFLVRLREQPAFSREIENIRRDGIFGLETSKATKAFQSHVGLEADGIVGADTREEAESLGAIFEPFPSSDTTEAVPATVRQGKIPIFPPPSPLPAPPPPPVDSGSTREESWKRLRAEAWRTSTAIKGSLEKAAAVLQSAADGSGDFVYDEYRVTATRLPENTRAEDLLKELASDLNGTIKNTDFDFINTFKRRNVNAPKAGEIVEIDIVGLDDGSVILGELGKTYFIYQTIDCAATRSHPENGSREFGFRLEGGATIFYTRGVSRPGNFLIGMLGSEPQRRGWTALMQGISSQINARGGASDFKSFATIKEKRAD